MAKAPMTEADKELYPNARELGDALVRRRLAMPPPKAHMAPGPKKRAAKAKKKPAM